MVDAEAGTPERLFADDMAWIHGTGRAGAKSTILDRIGEKKMSYHSFDNAEVTIHELNSLVLLAGPSAMIGIPFGPGSETTIRISVSAAKGIPQ